MFKQLYGAETGLDMLRLYKRIFDIKEINIGEKLESDWEYDAFYEAMSYLSENTESYYLEDYPENAMYKITYDDMPEFFRLCKLYARNHGISFRNCRYFRELDGFIDGRLSELHSYGISWKLVAPKKTVKKKTYHLFVETCGEYLYDYIDLAVALFDIDEYITDAANELLGVVANESKIIPFQKQTGKKAA